MSQVHTPVAVLATVVAPVAVVKVTAAAAAITAAQTPGSTAAALRKALWSTPGAVMIDFHGTPLEVAKKSILDPLTRAIEANPSAPAPFVFTPYPGGASGGLLTPQPAPVAATEGDTPTGDATEAKTPGKRTRSAT